MSYFNNFIENLTATVGNYIPGVFGALVILILGWFIAGLVKKMTIRGLKMTNIDEAIEQKIGSGFKFDEFLGNLFYYLIIIYVLVIVLNMMGVGHVLNPVRDMFSEMAGFLPNILAAGIITFAGFIISRFAGEATSYFASGIESFGLAMGIKNTNIDLSRILKHVVFIIIFVPILIVALDTLQMKAISEPATQMLGTFLTAVPQIIAAILLVTLFFVIGRYVVNILVDLMDGLGVDKLSDNMGLSKVMGDTSFTKTIGHIVMFFITFTGLIAAAEKLELVEVQTVLRDVFNIAGQVFFGLIILLIGLFISNIAVDAVGKSKENKWMTPIARFAIVGIFLAFALHTMGIAEDIVNLAFGLILGAIAIAFALAFGLGGREAAGKQMEYFFKKIRNEED